MAQNMKPITLLLSPFATNLAEELKRGTKSKPHIRIVERKTSQNSAQQLYQAAPAEPDCIATNLGTAFVILDGNTRCGTNGTTLGTSSTTRSVIPKLGSFRTAFLIILPGFLQDASNNDEELLLAANQEPNAILTLAHNLEEAAEFIISIVTKLGDEGARNQAHFMVTQAFEQPFEDPKRTVFESVANGLPIAAEESRAMLESLGSLAALAKCESVQELVSQTPLSDRDAAMVAMVLGISSGSPKQSVIRLM